MSEEIQPPAPKCPDHDIFMQYHSGQWPNRYYYCPQCHDHWIEGGQRNDGRTRINKAYVWCT